MKLEREYSLDSADSVLGSGSGRESLVDVIPLFKRLSSQPPPPPPPAPFSLFLYFSLSSTSTSPVLLGVCSSFPKMLSRGPTRALRRFPNVSLRSTTHPIQRTLATPAKAPSPNDPFANGTNTYYVEEMYRLWRQDPKSVHVSWDVYFSGMEKKGLTSPQAFQPPPNVVPMPTGGAPSLHSAVGGELDDHLKVSLNLVLVPLHRSAWPAL